MEPQLLQSFVRPGQNEPGVLSDAGTLQPCTRFPGHSHLLALVKFWWGEQQEKKKEICNFDARGAISKDSSWCL